MPEAVFWAEIGRASATSLWLPLGVWTLFAGMTEAGLRISRSPSTVTVRVRRMALLALPLALLVPSGLAWMAPDAALTVAALGPTVLDLPEVIVGARPDVGPAWDGWGALGLATGVGLLAGLAGLARWGLALVRLHQTQAILQAPDSALQRALTQARQRLGIRRPLRAARTAAAHAPFTFGWRRPVVAVPAGLDGDALALALTHEAAHVRSYDFLWNVIESAIEASFWLHPLVHTITDQAAEDREHLADAAVLEACPRRRRAYADLLLAYATSPSPRLALGAVRSPSSLHSSIDAMTRPLSSTHRQRLARWGRALGIASLLGFVGAATAFTTPSLLRPSDWLEGRVLDATSYTPLVGASLQIAGTTTGAATDRDGYYRIERPDGAFALTVSAPGYVPMTVQMSADQTTSDIALRPTGARPSAQSSPPRPLGPNAPDVFEVVETPPVLVGGLAGLQERIVYPPQAKQEGIEGRVMVSFIVTKEGRVEDARAIRSPHPMLSEAALDAVRGSAFEPGRQRGQAVKVRYTVPVRFVLPAEAASTDDG